MLQDVFKPTPTMNEKNGNGKYSPLRRRKKQQKKDENKAEDFKYLAVNDPRMRFNNSKDPIYYAFECLEKRSVMQLVGDLVKDSFFEMTNLVSKVVK